MKPSAEQQPAPAGPPTELGLMPEAAVKLRETMAAALQYAHTAAHDGVALTLSTPPEQGVEPRTVPPGPPLTALSGQVGPYQIVRPVGAGGMGAVYEAVDTRTGARVAVKSLLRMGPAELHRFKYEFRSMAAVGHPNLVSLYELSSHGGLWLIAMEFVEGADLCAALRALASHADAAPRLRALVRQLALGVAALHERGLLHRDLKPSNVLVTPAGRVVILDFGLVAELSRTGAPGEQTVGTPLYMAPEQCAGQLATTASDWYSVGVMLYEALTGKLPFSGGYAQIFLAKQCEEPPPPLGLPDDLTALIVDLLRRDPEHRATAARVLAWCGGAAPRPLAAPAGTVVFGRAAELEALEEALAAVARGRTACVYLRGAAGVGKSGLVQAFLAALQARGDVTVLSGRCYEHESVPFKAFDSLVDALADHLTALAPDALGPLLGAHTGELARLFPVLQRAPAVLELAQQTRPAASEQDSRRKGFAALKRLLAALAARGRLVLVLDDIHFTDIDSVHLLADLLAPPDAPALLLIAAYRADWPGSPQVLPEFERLQLRVWPELHATRLDVGRLDERDAYAAAAALLAAAGLPERPWAAAIADEARGDSRVLERLVDELAARRAGLGPHVLKDLSFERWLSEQVSALPADDRAVVELLAVAGAPLSVALLARALGDPPDLHARLARLHAARLLELGRKGRAAAAALAHERVRGVVLGGLGDDRARAHHRLLADTAAQQEPADLELLARHLFAAGDRERAAACADQAADQAAAALAFARAAELRDLALRCTPDAWPRLLASARALASAGRGVEAAERFLRAADLAPPEARTDARLRACDHLFAAGETARGERVLDDLLAGRGTAPLPAAGDVQAAFPRELSAALEPVRSDTPPAGADDSDLADALWAAARGLFIHAPVRAACFAARSAALAGAAADPARRARGLVMVMAVVALLDDTTVLGRLRRDIDDYLYERDDPYVVGLLAMMEGITAVARGRWSDALRDLEFGTAHLARHCTEVPWERNFGALMTMSVLESRGELRAIALRSAVMLEQARQTGDAMVEFVGAYYSALVLLAADDPAAARSLVASAARLGHVAEASAAGLRGAIIQALCALYAGDPAAAWRIVERASAVLAATPAAFARNQHANLRALHGQVATALAARAPAEERPALLAVVDADVAALRALATSPGLAHATLLAAARAALVGAPRGDVIAALAAAAAAYDAADMPLAAAATRHRLGCWLGDEDGEALFVRSEAFLRLQAIACPARWVALATPGLTPPT